jgi:hypothetical protein
MDDKSGDYTGATCLWRLDDRWRTPASSSFFSMYDTWLLKSVTTFIHFKEWNELGDDVDDDVLVYVIISCLKGNGAHHMPIRQSTPYCKLYRM